MKIAVQGCSHGDLDSIYATLLLRQEVDKIKIDLLICCGDFQAVRNENDLESLNVPRKYRKMNSFYKYYSGEKVAPFPTIFIGGNHEASNYLWELYFGGWAAPQIYFLGIAGVIKFGNVRIGGFSGVYKEHDYYSGHYEKLPYNENDIRSIYHVREFDVHKLMQVEEPIDIFISHDWPRGIAACGNLKSLLHRKPFLKQEIEEGTLGNQAATELLQKLKPSHWFSAHLHCKFSALVRHMENGSATKFLALDKCLPGRKFLQVIDIPSEVGPYEVQYDEEWLAITRKFNPAFPRTRYRANFSDAKLDIQDCRQFVRNKMRMRGGGKPFQFFRTAPCYNPGQPASKKYPSGHCRNPQTEALLQLLELQYFLDDSSASEELWQNQELFPSGDRTSAPMKAASPLGKPEGNVLSIWGGSNMDLNYSYVPNMSAYGNLANSGSGQVDSTHAIHSRGRGGRYGNIPHPQQYSRCEFGRGSGHYPNFRRGKGRSLGNLSASGRRQKDSEDPVSAEVRPDLYYDEEMLEDPWKGMTPVILEVPSSGKSWLPKSISMKKARTSSEDSHKSISQPSLAEYLAASFNENVDEPDT